MRLSEGALLCAMEIRVIRPVKNGVSVGHSVGPYFLVNGMPTGMPKVDPIAQSGPLLRPIEASTFLCKVFSS